MGRHQDILPKLVDACAAIHSECAVVLIGSVARGTPRRDSDIDLNIIFPGDDWPVGQSPWVDEDNRWQLSVRDEIDGIRIDVAWETQDGLSARVHSDDVINCWPFSNGTILRDPFKVAGPSLTIAQQWFADHPDAALRFEQQYAEAKYKQQIARGNDRNL